MPEEESSVDRQIEKHPKASDEGAGEAEGGPSAREEAFLSERMALLTPRGSPPPARARAVMEEPPAPAEAESLADGPGEANDYRAGPAAEYRRTSIQHYRDCQRKHRQSRSPEAPVRAAGAPAQPPQPLLPPPANNWIPIGPSVLRRGQGGTRPSTSGRTPGIAISPNGERVYIGSANGGVWRTQDSGETWEPLMNAFDLNPTHRASDSLACGAVALVAGATPDQDRIYVGSGEGAGGAFFGVGPVVSFNGGTDWATEPVSPASPDLGGSAFYALAVDPADADRVVAGTRFSAPGGAMGLYRREPDGSGGFHWDRKPLGGQHTWVTGVVVARAGGVTTFFAAPWFGPVFSSNDGHTWTPLGVGFPTADVGRISLAVQRNNPDIVYALVHDFSNDPNRQGLALGVWRYDAGDNQWRQVTGHPTNLCGTPGRGQASYDLAIAVDPADVDLIYLGGSTVLSNNEWSGSIYRNPVTVNGAGPGRTYSMGQDYIGNSIHADIHTIVFTPGNPDEMWVGCDGGVFRTLTPRANGNIFQHRNTGLATLTMNHLDQHPNEDAVVFCGTQDNGGVRYTGEQAWLYSSHGDGGFAVMNWNDPYRILSTHTFGFVRRSTNGGRRDSFAARPVPLQSGEPALFYAPLVGTPPNPASPAEAGIVAFGSIRPWISTDFSSSWQSIPNNSRAQDELSARIRSLAFASATRLYAGTMDGNVYRFDRVGGNWTRTAITPPLQGAPVTDIVVDPADATGGSIYIAFGGAGDYRHVWHFDGTLWEQRSGPAAGSADSLLDVQHNALAADPANPGTVYVGADIGVWRSTDSGATWEAFSDGLPDAAVLDLKLHSGRRLLRAATHGRSVYEFALDHATEPPVDLYVRDTQLDLGRRLTTDGLPDPTSLGQTVSHSDGPDIRFDAPSSAGQYQFAPVGRIDFLDFQQNLIDDSANVSTHTSSTVTTRVYVQVHNRGVTPANRVRVTLMLAQSPAAAPALPTGFDADIRNGVPVTGGGWETIGAAFVDDVRPEAPKIAAFNLTSDRLPSPAQLPGQDAHTVLALIHHPDDQFQTAQTDADALCLEDKKAALKAFRVTTFLGTVPGPQPAISSGGVINAALDPAIAPASGRSLVSIFGTDLASAVAQAGANPRGFLPTVLEGTEVKFGGVSAALLFVSPNQINAQVPDGVSGNVAVTVTTVSGGTSLAEAVNVRDVSPGIFVATKLDFSLIQPSNPVAVGDLIILWTTGLGEATPPVEAGRLAPPAPPVSVPNATPTATMDGISATVFSTALSPGFAGLEQVAVEVPSGVGSGAAAVELTLGGRTANVIQIHVA